MMIFFIIFFSLSKDVALGIDWFIKFKKNFEQFEGSSWYYESRNDDKIYESSIEHIGEQMRLVEEGEVEEYN